MERVSLPVLYRGLDSLISSYQILYAYLLDPKEGLMKKKYGLHE